jgi:energy-coupling factor transporter ATP-binding protein EcfA2
VTEQLQQEDVAVEQRGISIDVDQLSRQVRLGNRNQLTLLDAVSFSVSAGELVAIVGPSGAGKASSNGCRLSGCMSPILPPTVPFVGRRAPLVPLREALLTDEVPQRIFDMLVAAGREHAVAARWPPRWIPSSGAS